MTRFSFTGPEVLTADQDAYVREWTHRIFTSWYRPTEISSGAAHGVDTVAFDAGERGQPQATTRLVVPAAPHNDALVATQLRRAETQPTRHLVHYSAPGATRGEAYMNRNDDLVNFCETLLAFPKTITEELRSGTWATIRRARRGRRRVILVPLNYSGIFDVAPDEPLPSP